MSTTQNPSQNTPAKDPKKMEKIVALCKRRGIVFPGSEIYGGFANTWDFGPYGSQLLKNIKDFWWKTFVQEREDIVGLDSAILMNPKVWEASGHIGSFSDPLMDCKNCNERIRGDKLIEDNLGIEAAAGKSLEEVGQIIKENGLKCPKCGSTNFTEARAFNLMFKTHQGVVEETATAVYLRPETAQGIFVNFKNIIQNSRQKVPFGIAQIGKSFRNEITPGNFIFRVREFEQMEIEYFVAPDNTESAKNALENLKNTESSETEETTNNESSESEISVSLVKTKFDQWKEQAQKWYLDLGIRQENLRFREHESDELSHYSTMTFDIEYKFPFGWGELMGIAYRGCYDLSQHQKFSGQKLEYIDPKTNEKFIPHVIEPSFGLTRAFLTVILDAYDEDEIDGEQRTVMRFAKHIAPVRAAIFPLMKKEPLASTAREIFNQLKKDFIVEYDESGAIGKRYRRHDEIGTPYCITIDYDTLENLDLEELKEVTPEESRKKIQTFLNSENFQNASVTIRDRDTAEQKRVKISELKYLIS